MLTTKNRAPEGLMVDAPAARVGWDAAMELAASSGRSLTALS